MWLAAYWFAEMYLMQAIIKHVWTRDLRVSAFIYVSAAVCGLGPKLASERVSIIAVVWSY